VKYAWGVAAAATGLLAVSQPFDRLADASFAWHMAQHLLLFFAVPLFVLLARPFDLFTAVAGKPRIAVVVRAMRPLHVFGWPSVALVVVTAVWWGTHFSVLYEASLHNVWTHAFEHLLYVAAGTVFWLPVLGTPPLRPQSYPVRILYLLLMLPQGALLGVAIGAARSPLYAHYAAAMTPSAALADQQNAAAVMWIASGLIVLTGLLATLGVWAARETRDATLPFKAATNPRRTRRDHALP
jgi:putative membrane protein